MATQKRKKPTRKPEKKVILPVMAKHDDATDSIGVILHKIDRIEEGQGKLVGKVEGIEDGQTKIVDKLDSIHEAIYHQDTGLFAKIAAHRLENHEVKAEIEQEIVDIKAWRKQSEKDGEKDAKLSEKEEAEKKIAFETLTTMKAEVVSLKDYKTTVNNILKYAAGAIATGLLGLICKVIYNLATGGHAF